jgi:hypothetical protein
MKTKAIAVLGRPTNVSVIARQEMYEHKQHIKGLENRIEVLTMHMRDNDKLITLADNYRSRTIG